MSQCAVFFNSSLLKMVKFYMDEKTDFNKAENKIDRYVGRSVKRWCLKLLNSFSY